MDKHDAHRALVDRLRRQAADVQRLTSGLDESALATRTIPDKWSLKELVCHLWRVEDLFEGRIRTVLTQDNPQLTKYEPEGDAEFQQLVDRPASETLEGFLKHRDAFCQWLDQLTPADWHRKGRHPEFLTYDVHFQVEYMVHHEAHHIYQIFQRRIPLGKLPH